MLFCDRHFGTHIFTATGCHLVNGLPTASCGSPLLWQNLFWFFGHPEVYILALPFFGIATEVFPVFARKPVFGYKGMVFATMAIAALSTGVWAHNMFTTGAVLLPFFSFLSLLIAVPTGIKFFNWIGTLWHGQLQFTTAMLFSLGFLFAFLMGGVTGIMLGWPTSTRCSSGRPCSPASPASTTGTPRCSAGCSTRRWASGTSGCCSSDSG
jgi:cytochrome c oxidase subunit 1